MSWFYWMELSRTICYLRDITLQALNITSNATPFGMIVQERSLTRSEAGYRFGFNGQERDPSINQSYSYNSRIYDARLARWLSIDKLSNNFPNESNYNFVSNSPVLFKDIQGKYKVITTWREAKEQIKWLKKEKYQ